MASIGDESEALNKKIAEFVSITGASVGTAEQYLESNDYETDRALQDYFEDSVKKPGSSDSSATEAARPPSTGGFGVAGSSTSIPKSTTTKRKIRTFRDLANGTNDDDSSDDEKNLFTGGEKSGLQVENPNKNKNPNSLVEDILKKAADPANGRDSDEEPKKGPKFSGTGFKLGDSSTPSTQIPDRSSMFKKAERVERKITFWKDGFSVGDGPLYRYDDPRNGAYLRDLNSGRAPMELLDVQFGQDVDVNVDKRLDEDYKPPKRKLGGFVGKGQRLGSPVPGEAASPQAATAETTSETSKSSQQSESTDNNKTTDVGEGDAKLQIRFADGKRVVCKFNSSDPVQKVYDYVQSETNNTREFFLSLSFPVKPLADKDISIKDAGLVNAALIQRWV